MDDIQHDEISSGDMSEYEIALARACSDRSGWRVNESHLGYCKRAWVEAYRRLAKGGDNG